MALSLGAVETRSDQLKKQRAFVSKARTLLLPSTPGFHMLTSGTSMSVSAVNAACSVTPVLLLGLTAFLLLMWKSSFFRMCSQNVSFSSCEIIVLR